MTAKLFDRLTIVLGLWCAKILLLDSGWLYALILRGPDFLFYQLPSLRPGSGMVAVATAIVWLAFLFFLLSAYRRSGLRAFFFSALFMVAAPVCAMVQVLPFLEAANYAVLPCQCAAIWCMAAAVKELLGDADGELFRAHRRAVQVLALCTAVLSIAVQMAVQAYYDVLYESVFSGISGGDLTLDGVALLLQGGPALERLVVPWLPAPMLIAAFLYLCKGKREFFPMP